MSISTAVSHVDAAWAKFMEYMKTKKYKKVICLLLDSNCQFNNMKISTYVCLDKIKIGTISCQREIIEKLQCWIKSA